MANLEEALASRLRAVRAEGLYRELRRIDSPQATHGPGGARTFLNFSSNDYLGFAQHPALREAAQRALRDWGAGAGAARLLGGSLAPHHELEEALAAFKGTAAALTFASGYAAALGTIPALVGPGDVVVIDKLVHACLVDAARLSGATLRVFPHNDLNRLESILRWADQRAPITSHSASVPDRRPQVLVVTESVFSMDGDQAPLREMVDLKERFGAWLMVDEAHATGLYGPNRRGLAEALGVTDRIDVQMGTLGKALGAAGGFIGGPRVLIEYLINRARSFIFSTAPVPAAAAAATEGVRLAQAEDGAVRCAALWERVAQLTAALAGSAQPSAPVALPAPPRSAIIPLMIGDETEAMRVAAGLRDSGLLVPAVRYPTVPRRTARLRLTLSAAHTAAEVVRLATGLIAAGLPRSTRPSTHAPTGPA